MNKKILYAFIAGSMLSLSSCNDFLDVTPASGFTPEYVFSSEEEMKSLMTRIYSSMTEDGLYGSNLASGLNTNTDVEMSSFKNSTVNSAGSDIGCFDSKPYWNTLNSTWNNMYSTMPMTSCNLSRSLPFGRKRCQKTDLPRRSKCMVK